MTKYLIDNEDIREQIEAEQDRQQRLRKRMAHAWGECERGESDNETGIY
jgi:hypothetical protein